MNENSRKTVSVVVPVYFNSESLPLLLDRLQEVEQQLLASQFPVTWG